MSTTTSIVVIGYIQDLSKEMSREIEEIGEDSKSSTIKDAETNDVYVVVGKNDLYVVQWALDHAVSPGFRVCLVHIFPTIKYIPTPGNYCSCTYISLYSIYHVSDSFNNQEIQEYIEYNGSIFLLLLLSQ